MRPCHNARTAPDLTIVGEAATGAEAVDVAGSTKPDVVLMDVQMPDLDGIEATRRICTDPATSAVRVLILTTFDLDEYVFAALHAGASGFLLKDTRPTDLLDRDQGDRGRATQRQGLTMPGVGRFWMIKVVMRGCLDVSTEVATKE